MDGLISNFGNDYSPLSEDSVEKHGKGSELPFPTYSGVVRLPSAMRHCRRTCEPGQTKTRQTAGATSNTSPLSFFLLQVFMSFVGFEALYLQDRPPQEYSDVGGSVRDDWDNVTDTNLWCSTMSCLTSGSFSSYVFDNLYFLGMKVQRRKASGRTEGDSLCWRDAHRVLAFSVYECMASLKMNTKKKKERTRRED